MVGIPMRTLIALLGLLAAESAMAQNKYGPQGNVIDLSLQGAACNATTDDTTAWNTALSLAASTSNVVLIPEWCQTKINAGQISLSNISIIGEGPRDTGINGSYGKVGSQIILTNPTAAPFIVGSSVKFKNVTFYWPNQTEAMAAVTVPLFVSCTSGCTQSDTVKVTGFGQQVSVNIPANTGLATAAILIAQASTQTRQFLATAHLRPATA